MAKPKKKLTAAQRAAKTQRQKDFMFVFMNGKQVRVRRPPALDGSDAEEFIRQNADPIWLHQHGAYEILHERATEEQETPDLTPTPTLRKSRVIDDSDIPF